MALFWVLAAFCFTLDRAAKLLANAYLRYGESQEALFGLVRLELTRNDGMALGILSGYPALIVLLPVAAVIAGAFALRKYQKTNFTAAAAALIVGGFLGNIVDRLCYGYVLDMLFFPFLPFFVCNIADVAITLGVALMAYSLLFRPKDWRRADAESSG